MNTINFPISGPASPDAAQSRPAGGENAELRRAAMEFESIMLTQLTAALRSEAGDDEEPLFGGGQSDLARQMFGEQLAIAMSKGGGIGLADLIVRQMSPEKHEPSAKPFERAVQMVRHLRGANASPTTVAVASSAEAAPEPVEPLANMTRPRRVSDITNAEPAGADAAKPSTPPETLSIKRATVEAPSQPNANVDASVNMTRPRRVFDSTNVETNSGTDVVRIPLSPETQAIKRAFAEAAPQASYTGRPKIDAIIEQASARHGIDPHLLAAVMRTESGGRQFAVSGKGASGLMQIMPATFRQFAGQGRNIFDPKENINVGAAYLKVLSERYDGSIDKILAGYNAGMGNVDKYGGVPPFRETRNFVAKVKRHFNDLVAASRPADSKSEQSSSSSIARNTVVAQKPPVEGTRVIVIKQESDNSTVNPVDLQTPAQMGSRQQTEGSRQTVDPVDLQMPVQGRISSQFGARRNYGPHAGVDIAVPRGTPIEASAAGEVVFAGWSGGYGKTVLIKHQDGVYTRYAHADQILVSRGDSVRVGQQVATVGSTGHATGPHLHFEVLRDKQHVNPLRAIAENPIRNVEVMR